MMSGSRVQIARERVRQYQFTDFGRKTVNPVTPDLVTELNKKKPPE